MPQAKVHAEQPEENGIIEDEGDLEEVEEELTEYAKRCNRCEEWCCPGFWNDDGVPPLPVLNWVFDPQNKYLNDNHFCNTCDSRRTPF